MTHVVLLSAGQGKRLSPLTDKKPKCLVSVGGKTLLEWQLQAIEKCNVDGVTIVTGFEARSVEAAVKVMPVSLPVQCVFNPFYSVADNIGSCWMVRDRLLEGAVLINGDTLFDHQILARLLNHEDSSITVTVDEKEHYDSDDMKVKLKGGRLTRIGKTLTGKVDAESIGMLKFRKEGGAAFVNEMETLFQDPASLRLWYLSIIDRLAPEGEIGVMSVDGLPWQEVDFPHDVAAAEKCVATFDRGSWKDTSVTVSTLGTGLQDG